MTLVSNELFLGPFIKASRITSYFAGSWRASLMTLAMYQFNFGCGFAVASAVGLIYDWGEYD
jgi:hypothetical protein